LTTQTIETPAEPAVADPEPIEVQTEEPATEVVVEPAATPDETAAVPQVEVTEPEKPDYMTRADWEREKSEVANRAASEALELDRRRRQTENARRATAEKREAEERIEARDTVKAAFGAAGIYEVPDEAVYSAIDRVARKQAASMTASGLDVIESAFDFIAAPAYGQQAELDEASEPAARRLAPKIQSLIDTIRPQIEAKAREGYIAESELGKRVDAEIARRNAKNREGQTDLQRVEGNVTAGNKDSIEYWERRVAHEGEDGVPDMTQSDWATYKTIRRQRGYS